MPVSNGSAYNIDCSDITGWTDGDTGEGVSSQVTFDTKSCFKFNTVTSADTDDRAQRSIDFGSVEAIGNRIVVSLNLYCDAIGTNANADYLLFSLERSDWRLEMKFASDGLFIRNSTGAFVEVGTSIVTQDVWQEWTFDIDLSAGVANAVVDVYRNNVLMAENFSCNRTGAYVDGKIILIQYGYITNSRISYVDWLKIGSRFVGENVVVIMQNSNQFNGGSYL